MNRAKTSVWIVTDGRPGNAQQARGLLYAMVEHCKHTGHRVLGREYAISLKKDFAFLPPSFWPTRSSWFVQRAIDTISPDENIFRLPAPDIVIGVGRKSAPVVAALKCKSPHTFSVQLMNPQMNTKRFDVIISPQHDQMAGLNVIQTLGALHTVTPQRLSKKRKELKSTNVQDHPFHHLPAPYVGVLLGGKSRSANFNEQSIHDLGRRLQKLYQEGGCKGSIVVTPSRRTTPVLLAKLQSYLTDMPHYIWDGKTQNPYLAILSLSDMLVVSEDSVNMVTEATATGKPVYIAQAQSCSGKIASFHRGLYDLALTRPFRGNWETWSPKPLFEADNIAKAILSRQQAHRDKYFPDSNSISTGSKRLNRLQSG